MWSIPIFSENSGRDYIIIPRRQSFQISGLVPSRKMYGTHNFEGGVFNCLIFRCLGIRFKKKVWCYVLFFAYRTDVEFIIWVGNSSLSVYTWVKALLRVCKSTLLWTRIFEKNKKQKQKQVHSVIKLTSASWFTDNTSNSTSTLLIFNLSTLEQLLSIAKKARPKNSYCNTSMKF